MKVLGEELALVVPEEEEEEAKVVVIDSDEEEEVVELEEDAVVDVGVDLAEVEVVSEGAVL